MRCVLVMRWAGFLLLFAGAALAQSWMAYSPEAGRYRIDMPAPPVVTTEPITWGGE
jgi:hypothetical protein